MHPPPLTPWLGSCLLLLGSLPPPPATAAPANQGDRCTNGIVALRRTLETDYSLAVLADYYDVAHHYQSYPPQRPEGYTFWLRGAAAESILNSPQLMGRFSADLLAVCETASAVRFGIEGTGQQAVYGLMDQGRVERFRCLAEGDSGPPGLTPWGYQLCSPK